MTRQVLPDTRWIKQFAGRDKSHSKVDFLTQAVGETRHITNKGIGKPSAVESVKQISHTAGALQVLGKIGKVNTPRL